MVSVRVNGEESPVKPASVTKVADLIELIKANIDPEHMITQILVDGRELTDADWAANLNQYETGIFEFETDKPEKFVVERMAQASSVVGACYVQFRESRKCFQDGSMQDGNLKLIGAVNTAKAFFEWYFTIMELAPADKKSYYDINPQVSEIVDICKRICQQQLYQSWWALGETLEKELEPKLDKLEDHLRKFAHAV